MVYGRARQVPRVFLFDVTGFLGTRWRRNSVLQWDVKLTGPRRVLVIAGIEARDLLQTPRLQLEELRLLRLRDRCPSRSRSLSCYLDVLMDKERPCRRHYSPRIPE